jgi:hypothetical protein
MLILLGLSQRPRLNHWTPLLAGTLLPEQGSRSTTRKFVYSFLQRTSDNGEVQKPVVLILNQQLPIPTFAQRDSEIPRNT